MNQKNINFLCEYAPLIIFGLAYAMYGLMPATFALVVATVIAALVSYISQKKIPMMMSITAIVVALFGGLTLYFDDPQFIKMKPTIVQIIFAVILLGSAAVKKPIIALLLQKNLNMHRDGWMKLTVRLGIFFIIMAGLNEYVWRNYSDDIWVSFKLFALPLLSIIFFAAQYPLFKKYIIEDKREI